MMDLSEPPRNGDVIHYSYLWRDEKRRGLEEGRKARPSTVILAKRDLGKGVCRILVLPISHTPPPDSDIAIEITDMEKRAIGLDGDRQWIICNEVNQFIWPGFDVRAMSGGEYKYGMMPRGLFERARKLFLERQAAGRPKPVIRD